MYQQGIGDFKYFVGIGSLSQIATREDRVCVLFRQVKLEPRGTER